MTNLECLMASYGALLADVDSWFKRCTDLAGAEIACSRGCSECCRGLFDITLLDACYLKSGFERLPGKVRTKVLSKCHTRLSSLQKQWPEFIQPYILNLRPENDWEELMPDDDATPCPLLGEDGLCLVYEQRPMTCRLHGLPMVEISGDILFDEWCTLNFIHSDPRCLEGLRWEFNNLFKDELSLFRMFTKQLLNRSMNELDTFIPTALLIEFGEFDWQTWAGSVQKFP